MSRPRLRSWGGGGGWAVSGGSDAGRGAAEVSAPPGRLCAWRSPPRSRPQPRGAAQRGIAGRCGHCGQRPRGGGDDRGGGGGGDGGSGCMRRWQRARGMGGWGPEVGVGGRRAGAGGCDSGQRPPLPKPQLSLLPPRRRPRARRDTTVRCLPRPRLRPQRRCRDRGPHNGGQRGRSTGGAPSTAAGAAAGRHTECQWARTPAPPLDYNMWRWAAVRGAEGRRGSENAAHVAAAAVMAGHTTRGWRRSTTRTGVGARPPRQRLSSTHAGNKKHVHARTHQARVPMARAENPAARAIPRHKKEEDTTGRRLQKQGEEEKKKSGGKLPDDMDGRRTAGRQRRGRQRNAQSALALVTS